MAHSDESINSIKQPKNTGPPNYGEQRNSKAILTLKPKNLLWNTSTKRKKY